MSFLENKDRFFIEYVLIFGIIVIFLFVIITIVVPDSNLTGMALASPKTRANQINYDDYVVPDTTNGTPNISLVFSQEKSQENVNIIKAEGFEEDITIDNDIFDDELSENEKNAENTVLGMDNYANIVVNNLNLMLARTLNYDLFGSIFNSFVTSIFSDEVYGYDTNTGASLGASGCIPPIDIPAFPGAEGFGSDSVGGRGNDHINNPPQIIEVTNLNDNGAGSLREAIEQTGPRIIIFKVGGTIFLESPLIIENPYVTIAGQTAPGDGITIAHYSTYIKTHDVVLQYLRFRILYDDATESPIAGSARDAITMVGDSNNIVNNVIIDHSSFGWGVDESVDVHSWVEDVTIQWSIISEGSVYGAPWGPQAYAFLGAVPNDADDLGIPRDLARISLHHNVLAHNSDRSPYISAGAMHDIRNNIVYNWRQNGVAHLGHQYPFSVNLVGNYYIRGKDSYNGNGRYVVLVPPNTGNPLPQFYLESNLAPSRTSQSQDDWDIGVSDGAMLISGIPNPYRLNNEVSTPLVTTHDTETAFDLVMQQAGESDRRDQVDTRLIGEIRYAHDTFLSNQDYDVLTDSNFLNYGPHHGDNTLALLLKLTNFNLNEVFGLQYICQTQTFGCVNDETEKRRLLAKIIVALPGEPLRNLNQNEIDEIIANTSPYCSCTWEEHFRMIPTESTVSGLYEDMLNPVLPQDSDNDNIPDSWENIKGTDPNLDDSLGDIDCDGYLNIEEYIHEIPDIDSDSLPDVWEMLYFGNLDYDGDDNPDGDSFTNLEEYLNGLNPNSFDQLCLSGQTRSCGTDVGICEFGTQTCNSAGYWGSCTEGIEPISEICDALDNDCDGEVDEQSSGIPLTQSCYSGSGGTENVGICVGGTQTCASGLWGSCVGEITPQIEICDSSLDDDCDGSTDLDDSNCVPECNSNSDCALDQICTIDSLCNDCNNIICSDLNQNDCNNVCGITYCTWNSQQNICEAALGVSDTDNDGVDDSDDRCRGDSSSQGNIPVNSFGCPLPNLGNFVLINPDPSTLYQIDLLNVQDVEFGDQGSNVKVKFLDEVDLVNEEVVPQIIYIALDFSAITITSNEINMDLDDFPDFNVPAQLTFYNVNFVQPKILKDGVECTTCTFVSYNNNQYAVNVPGFSTYEVVEGQATTTWPSEGSPSGGGGRSGRTPQCRDGVDNDRDGLKDYPNDHGCIDNRDNSEVDVVECRERWVCDDYGECIDNIQTRQCYDLSNCGTIVYRPILREPCYEGSLTEKMGEKIDIIQDKVTKHVKRNNFVYVILIIIIGTLLIIEEYLRRKKSREFVKPV